MCGTVTFSPIARARPAEPHRAESASKFLSALPARTACPNKLIILIVINERQQFSQRDHILGIEPNQN